MGWGAWQPRRFVRFERALRTSMGTAIVITDAGRAFVKAMGNREGLHTLACELIGSSLADLLGLHTFDFALLPITVGDEIPLGTGGHALPGPAFAARAVRGREWDGDAKDLTRLDNPDDLAGLVVVDTWLRNPDRCDARPQPAGRQRWRPRYANVYLA